MRLLHDAKYMTSSVLAGLVLASARSVLVLRLLGPALIGPWKTAMLLDTGGEFLRLGILKALGIRIPVLRAQGRQEEAEQVARATGGFLLWLGAAFLAGIFGASFLVQDPALGLALRYVAVVLGIGQVYYYTREMAAASHKFVLRAKETLLRSGVDFLLAIVLCRYFGLSGLGVATVLGLVAATLYLRKHQRAPLDLAPRARVVRESARAGLPFALTEAAYELARRLDVIAIAFLFGSPMVGQYAVSLLILDFAVILAHKGIAQVVSPHLLREYGRSGSHRELAGYYEKPARLFCYALPPAIGAGSFFLGDFVRLLLPQYEAGIRAAEVTLWAVFFVALHASICSFFAASGTIHRVLRMYAVLIPAAGLGQVLVARLGGGLPGAAWCAVATLGAAAAMELAITRRSCGEPAAGIARFLFGMLLPVAVAMGLRELVAGMEMGPPAQAALLLALYAPLLAGYEVRFAMLRTVRQAL